MKRVGVSRFSVIRDSNFVQTLFLALLVFAIYFPTIGGEVSIVDDRLMIDSLLNNTDFSLTSIFFPQSENAGYYRPLIGLSFLLDKMLWLLDERMMHLENLFLHILNVVLVFFLTRAVTVRNQQSHSVVPFVAALLFGIHPLTTESVNWISGRTDVLAGTFVLSCALMLVRYNQQKKISYLCLATLFLLLGIISKEVAVAFVMAAPFLLWPRDRAVTITMTPFVHIVIVLLLLGIAMSGAIFLDNYWLSILSAAVYFFVLLSRIEQLPGKRREVARTAWLSLSVTGLAAVGIALAVVLRRLAFTSDMGKFGRLVTLMADDPNHTISVFLGALGFYVKKFFLPLPLRFFILEVEPLYDFVGMAVLLGIALMIIRRTLPAVFILAGACMLAPSLPLAFGTVAWTGYAERYVYIAAAFWSVALFAGIASLKVFDGWVRWKKFVVAACTVTVVITFASVTFTRNLQWRHNTGILADTVNKAPRAKTIRIMYAFALLLENRIPEAKREADIARTLYSLEYDENVDIVTAAILKESGQLKEAESCYREAVQRTKFRSANALASIIRFYEDFLRDDQNDDARILKKLVFYAEKQAALTGNPYHFYKVGQYLLHQGDHAGAVTCFRKARDTFPPDNPFKGYSERILVKLCGNGTKKPCLPECRQINDKR